MDVWKDEEGEATIGVYGLDGVRQASLTVPAALERSGDDSPVWSRDGSSILLPYAQVPLDGGAPTPLPAEVTGEFGAYSPDGSRFAYVHRGSLEVEDVRAPDAQMGSGSWEFWDVAWSPNDELVAYDRDERELLVRDVATGTDTSLVTVPQPESLAVLEFSSDGERIFFRRSDDDGSSSSLWSIRTDGSDIRRVLDGVDWADLRPGGRP
jgi:Tol biopolymer transport system component